MFTFRCLDSFLSLVYFILLQSDNELFTIMLTCQVFVFQDMDPTFTCWKGAAVLACLDTAQELWIRQKEWKQFSVRMLRERAPFTW